MVTTTQVRPEVESAAVPLVLHRVNWDDYEAMLRIVGDRHIRVTVDVNGIRVRPSEALVSEVEQICGTGSVTLR